MLDVSIFFYVTHCTFFINKKEGPDFGSLPTPIKKDPDAEVFLLLYLNPYTLFPIFCCCLTFYYNSDYECNRHQWESYRRGTANFPI